MLCITVKKGYENSIGNFNCKRCPRGDVNNIIRLIFVQIFVVSYLCLLCKSTWN